jgi:hypothetical protein
MKERLVAYMLSISAVSAILAGCGQQQSDDQTSSSTSGTGTFESTTAPQYLEPTLDNLKGKPQPFPSKYPLTRFPRGKVTFALVRRDLPPGWKNQVMLNVTEPSKDGIVHYYRNELQTGGWKLVSQYENPIYSSTIWQKGDREVEVRVSPDQYNNQNVQLFEGPIYKKKYGPH